MTLSYFFVGQVAGRILFPEVTGDRFGTGAEVSVAKVQVGTLGTATFQNRLTVLEASHNRVAFVAPDFAEATFANVAQRNVLGELVRVNITDAVDVTEGHAAAVAAIALDEFQHLFRTSRVFALHAQVQVDGIGVVIDRQDFLVDSALLEVQGAIDDQVHRLAAFFVTQVVLNHRRTAAAINQVVETHAVDILGFKQIKNCVQVLHIVTRNGKAKAHLLPRCDTVADATESELVSTFLAAELVVSRLATVQANAHVTHAHVLEFTRHIGRNAGAVRADGRADSLGGRIVRQFRA